jgi:hypothetical protein
MALYILIGLCLGGWLLTKTAKAAANHPETTWKAGKGLWSLFK